MLLYPTAEATRIPRGRIWATTFGECVGYEQPALKMTVIKYEWFTIRFYIF